MTTAFIRAPTLEDLPPQKGSILELHSIGRSDFDGLIVEFLSVDKSTGKYHVASMKNGQGMLVKPKVCRRPDMKPYRLRQDLAKKANGFLGGLQSSATLERSMNALLSMDPFCAPVYFALGATGYANAGVAGRLPPPDVQKKVIQNLQRGFATLYAYEDVMDKDLIQDYKRMLAIELGDAGRSKASSRVDLGKVPKGGDLMLEIAKAWQEFFAAEGLQKSAGDLKHQKHDTKQFENLNRAVDRYLTCVRACAGIKCDEMKWKKMHACNPYTRNVSKTKDSTE